jgi:hypothetical protein
MGRVRQRWLTHHYTYDCIKVGSAGRVKGLFPGTLIKWQKMCLSTIVIRLVVKFRLGLRLIMVVLLGDYASQRSSSHAVH